MESPQPLRERKRAQALAALEGLTEGAGDRQAAEAASSLISAFALHDLLESIREVAQ